MVLKYTIPCWVRGMLDEKSLRSIEKNIPMIVKEGDIFIDPRNKALTSFYLNNALISLKTAKILDEVSNDKEIKKQFDFIDDNFESYLWIINTSYYSMFYTAGALLADSGIKVKSEIGVHKKTFEALVFYFYLNKKIAKKYLEDFEEAQRDSRELLGTEEPIEMMQKKAKELIKKYEYELGKRGRFTYEMGEIAKAEKAKTSLARALEFYNECLKMMSKPGRR